MEEVPRLVVKTDPRAVLQSLCDRGVSRVVIEDQVSRPPRVYRYKQRGRYWLASSRLPVPVSSFPVWTSMITLTILLSLPRPWIISKRSWMQPRRARGRTGTSPSVLPLPLMVPLSRIYGEPVPAAISLIPWCHRLVRREY